MKKPCTECGEPHEGQGRCDVCARVADAARERPSTKSLGYTGPWRRLSKRARSLQRFCSVCGATTDLTTDHSEEAWRRHNAGLAIRLCDVDVLCRPCNARKGTARTQGDSPWSTG